MSSVPVSSVYRLSLIRVACVGLHAPSVGSEKFRPLHCANDAAQINQMLGKCSGHCFVGPLPFSSPRPRRRLPCNTLNFPSPFVFRESLLYGLVQVGRQRTTLFQAFVVSTPCCFVRGIARWRPATPSKSPCTHDAYSALRFLPYQADRRFLSKVRRGLPFPSAASCNGVWQCLARCRAPESAVGTRVVERGAKPKYGRAST